MENLEEKFHNLVLTKDKAHNDFREHSKLMFSNYIKVINTLEQVSKIINRNVKEPHKKYLDINIEMIQDVSRLEMEKFVIHMDNLFHVNEILIQFIAEINDYDLEVPSGLLN